MTKTLRLTDLQRILLATAAARDNGRLYPVKDSIADRAADVAKALTSLARRGLIMGEEETAIITEPGKALIDGGEDAAPLHSPATPSAAVKRISKTDAVLTLLQRERGATLTDLIAATGWLPHTIRAAMTGLRRKGYAIVRGAHDGVTVWTIAAAA